MELIPEETYLDIIYANLNLYKNLFQTLSDYYQEVLGKYNILKITPTKLQPKCYTQALKNIQSLIPRYNIEEKVKKDLENFSNIMNEFSQYLDVLKHHILCRIPSGIKQEKLREIINKLQSNCQEKSCINTILDQSNLYTNLNSKCREINKNFEDLISCLFRQEKLNEEESPFNSNESFYYF